MKMERVLVGVDFSEVSSHALDFALKLSAGLDASLEVLHVVSPPPYVPMDLMLWGNQEQEYIRRLRQELDALLASAAGSRAAEIHRKVEVGVPYDLLVTASEDADVLVLGTHGRTGLSQILLGSVAERTLRFARCPVITVPRR